MVSSSGLLRVPGVVPFVIGHRGARGHAPENTMRAFARGIELGGDFVECDVHLTADGEVVVIHDEDLERTTSGQGLVSEHSLEALRRLDAGEGQPIPSLDDLLAWLAPQCQGVVVEIKNGPIFYPDIARKVGQVLVRHSMCDRAIVISFDHVVVRDFKGLYPDVMTGVLYHARLVDPVAVARAARADSLWPSVEMLTADAVQAARRAGLGIFTWTANSPEEIRRVVELGVDGACSDYPEQLARAVAR